MRLRSTYLCIFFLFLPIILLSENKIKNNQILRDVKRVYDSQQNSVSNIQLFSTNYGIHSNDVEKSNTSGCYWPRNSNNSYNFGGGIWFAAIKNGRKLVEISYNPNNGKSWFIPGHYRDGDSINPDKYLYRIYYSTDFDSKNGKSNEMNNNSLWPYWNTNNSKTYPLNSSERNFVFNVNDRNLATYPNGPNIISDEDFHAIYKDTDMRQFDGGAAYRKALGYPLRLQIEEHNYTWKNEDFKDAMIRVYEIENFSNDTLFNCYFAPIMDIDIIREENGKVLGNFDDKIKYFSEDSCMRMGVAWSGFDSTRVGRGFGYFAFNVIESPTLDKNGFIEQNIPIYNKNRQIGINRFGIWNMESDMPWDTTRYDYLSKKQIDMMDDKNDIRVLYSLGPFNLLPKAKARFSLGYAFALPASSGEANGEYNDITGMPFGAAPCGNHPSKNGSVYSKIKKVTDLYYNEIVLAIANQNQTSDFSISPNPASDYIYLNVGVRHALPLGESIEIFNIFGEKTTPSNLSGLPPLLTEGGETRIDVSNLPAGVYFIKIGDRFEKFVKM